MIPDLTQDQGTIRQLAYMLAQITEGAATATVRDEDTENGFEI